MPFPRFFYCAFILHFGLAYCSGIGDTITPDNPIKSAGSILVSTNKTFALGFFTPNGNSLGKQYVGIWYYGRKPQTIVWVANPGKPVSNSTDWNFGIGRDGNLMLFDGTSHPMRLTNVESISARSTRTLKLHDSGNLVLSVDQDSSSMKVVWQSFSHPTDTFLPGMKISGIRLTSWSTQNNPAPGRFVFRQDSDVERHYIITDHEAIPYWKSGLSGNGDEIIISLLLNNDTKINTTNFCSILNATTTNCSKIQNPSYDYHKNSRLVMGSDGKLRFYRWDADNHTNPWSWIWMEPSNICSVYEVCGKFGSCNDENRVHCKCLPGFKPQSPDNWNKGYFSEGCTTETSGCPKEFLKLSKMKVQKPDSEFGVNDENECKNRCVNYCPCQAYSFAQDESYRRDRPSNFTCRMWLYDVNNVQESYTEPSGGHDLYLRFHRSEKGNRACDPCGTNIIPYPLSTGLGCGDPNYFRFNCSTESYTGLLSFNASGQIYRVSSINPESLTFSIQIEEKCRPGEKMEKLLHGSSPFFVNSTCTFSKYNFTTDSSSEDKWFYEVEIGWEPPLEPICGSSEDCNDLENSSCRKAADGRHRCICNRWFHWDPSNIGCTLLDSNFNRRREAFEKQKILYVFFMSVTAAMLFLLCTALAMYHKRGRRMVQRRGNLELSLYNIERWVKDFISSGEFKEDDKKDIDVPYFDLETILVATDNFSEANKLGQGGFGPVYKGKLPQGQEIAIKRLSRGSGQGLEEFKNEVVLIAKLQHRNLVRLLGYCVKGYEKMLIYEYMPNKSLDSFIFDRTRCALLNWEKRMDIILGIARGLLYLHQDSRLRIIHRDLKTSNILLDEEMTPKISDFGLARIFGGTQTEHCTNRVVGTYGYMSPEYALDGFFSIKSDVFSFGVVLLETITGKRNTGFFQAKQPLSLLGYAWRLWNDNRVLDLVDPRLHQIYDANEFARYVNVGLLCVQEDPSERPTMSNVLFMLGSETPSLPIPKQPAYVVRRSHSSSTSTKQAWSTEITTSLEKGR